MADLKIKYSRLISLAQESKVQNLSVSESNNVLHISGTTTPEVKDKLWNMYGQIDPDMRSGDLVMDISAVQASQSVAGNKENAGETYEVKSGDSLSKIAQHYPHMTWKDIYDANKDVLDDPNKILPGQKLRIPLEQ